MAYMNLDDDPRMEQQFTNSHLKGEIEMTEKQNKSLYKKVISLERRIISLEKVLKKHKIK